MHELPIAQSILDISLRHAQQAGATRVTDLHLVIGKFSYVVDDSIQFYWDMIAKDTIAEGARLHFEPRPRRIPMPGLQPALLSRRRDPGLPPLPEHAGKAGCGR